MEWCGWQRAKYNNNICVAYVAPRAHNNIELHLYYYELLVASTMPLQYVATTDANRP